MAWVRLIPQENDSNPSSDSLERLFLLLKIVNKDEAVKLTQVHR